MDSAGLVNIAGQASDDQWIKLVSWANDRGGSGTATLSGSSRVATWTVTGVLLQVGDNRLTFTAQDASGNTSSTSVVVTRVATGIKAISSVDLLAVASAVSPFKSLDWDWSAECAGQVKSGLNIPETGLLGSYVSDAWGSLRLGKVDDPQAPGKKVFAFRTNVNDPVTAGNPRCELSASPTRKGRLPINETFWFAVGFSLPNWTATSDAQIIAQWHVDGGGIALSPLLALSVQGDKLGLILRHNANYPVSMATTVDVVALDTATLPINKWTYLVFKARLSTNKADGPFLQVWQDGRQVVNYSGPIGYNLSDNAPFAKLGFYHWIESSNRWPVDVPTRTVLVRTPIIVSDKAGSYQEPDLRAHVVAR